MKVLNLSELSQVSGGSEVQNMLGCIGGTVVAFGGGASVTAPVVYGGAAVAMGSCYDMGADLARYSAEYYAEHKDEIDQRNSEAESGCASNDYTGGDDCGMPGKSDEGLIDRSTA